MSSSRKIGVLLGGQSVERDALGRTSDAIVSTLRQMGHEACPLFVDRDIDLVLRQAKIDVAFLAVRGRRSADGCLQGCLELQGIPYTGCGILACSLAMNRSKTKDVLRMFNLPVASGYVLRSDHESDLASVHGCFGYPAVVRPMGAALLVGGTIARDEMELESALEDAFRFEDEALVERFMPGCPITVAVLDGVALGVMEAPKAGSWSGLGSLAARGDKAGPLRLSRERHDSVLRLAAQAYEALGCEGPVCVEMLISERFNETIVDIDTSPLLLPSSPLPRIAESCGIGYQELVEEILLGAHLRTRAQPRNRRASRRVFESPDLRPTALSDAH